MADKLHARINTLLREYPHRKTPLGQSLAEPVTHSIVHQLAHALWHLPAQAPDIVLAVDVRRRILQPLSPILLGLTPRLYGHRLRHAPPDPGNSGLVKHEIATLSWLNAGVGATKGYEAILLKCHRELRGNDTAARVIEAIATINEACLGLSRAVVKSTIECSAQFL